MHAEPKSQKRSVITLTPKLIPGEQRATPVTMDSSGSLSRLPTFWIAYYESPAPGRSSEILARSGRLHGLASARLADADAGPGGRLGTGGHDAQWSAAADGVLLRSQRRER